MSLADLPEVHPRSRAAWRRWLERHHLTARGCWFVTWRRETGKPRVDYAEAVEELLCFGWVDSTARRLDDARTALLCTPRKPRSGWARSNRERVARLTAQGLMAARGLEVVAEAKRTGQWTALDALESLEVPPDLAARLRALPPARKRFDAFPPSARKRLLAWIRTAKRPETRARRVEETALAAQQGLRANG